MAEICRKRGALLIIDEMRTGLSRSGKFWMMSPYAFEPDIMILGKGFGTDLYLGVAASIMLYKAFNQCCRPIIDREI